MPFFFFCFTLTPSEYRFSSFLGFVSPVRGGHPPPAHCLLGKDTGSSSPLAVALDIGFCCPNADASSSLEVGGVEQMF